MKSIDEMFIVQLLIILLKNNYVNFAIKYISKYTSIFFIKYYNIYIIYSYTFYVRSIVGNELSILKVRKNNYKNIFNL